MASTLRFSTNLNCQKCVASVTPHLDGAPEIERWEVDTSTPQKILTVHGTHVGQGKVEELVAKAGFRVLEQLDPDPTQLPAGQQVTTELPKKSLKVYYPLILVAIYLIIATVGYEISTATWDSMRAMRHFMAGFFIVFSFFKLLNLRSFVDSYQGYDLLAKQSRAYGYLYPFLELGLGIAYLTNVAPIATNVITLVVMLLGMVGIVQVLRHRQTIQCACLGTVFQLPMSTVTLVENGLMVLMAAGMLLSFVSFSQF
ncbi:MAG: copper chaperone [Zavarzinella sp.]